MDQAFQEIAEQELEETVESYDDAPALRPALAMARAASARQAEAEATTGKTRAWLRDGMMLIRRAHLYAGLLMLPWVLLYGVTAFLFNHPNVFSDQTIVAFSRDQMRGTPLEGLPTAVEIAKQVVALLNNRASADAYRLVQPEAVRFDRGGLSANVQAEDGKRYTASFDPAGDGGSLRAVVGGAAAGAGAQNQGQAKGGPRRGQGQGQGEGEEGAREGGPRRERGQVEPQEKGQRGRRGGGGGEGAGADEAGPRAPFAVSEGLTLDASPLEKVEQGLPAVLGKIGMASSKITEVRSAPLSFQMEGEGRRWLVSYNMQTGSVSGRSTDDPALASELSTRRFLTRLHTVHGYPNEFGARWIWALIVDAMAFIMVFWGVSGVIMWWQMKRLRRIGAVALTVSAAAAIWVGVGMHNFMIMGGR